MNKCAGLYLITDVFSENVSLHATIMLSITKFSGKLGSRPTIYKIEAMCSSKSEMHLSASKSLSVELATQDLDISYSSVTKILSTILFEET